MILLSLAPNVPPMVQVARISASTILVSWTSLILSEACGFITNYTVAYSLLSGGSKQQILNIVYQIVSAALNETTIKGLDESTAYLVQVSASTVVGAGVLSEPLLVAGGGISVAVFSLKHFFICYV